MGNSLYTPLVAITEMNNDDAFDLDIRVYSPQQAFDSEERSFPTFCTTCWSCRDTCNCPDTDTCTQTRC